MLRLIFVLGILGAIGCNDAFAPYYRVIDLRILALAADKPELLSNVDVVLDTNVSALALGAPDIPWRYRWQLCPEDGQTLTCALQAQQSTINEGELAASELATAPIDKQRQSLLRIRQEGVIAASFDAGGSVRPIPIPDFNPSRVSVDVLGADLTGLIFASGLAQSPVELAIGLWPLVALHVWSDDGQSITAVKRLVVGLEDIAEAGADVLPSFGIIPCPQDEPKPANCVAFPPKTPNQNPNLQAIEVRFDEPWITWDGNPLVLRAKDKVAIRPLLAQDTAESYTIYEADARSNRITPIPAVENISISWFCSAGDLLSEFTWSQNSTDFENTFVAPDELPSLQDDGYLWLVLRDQRGGTSLVTIPILWDRSPAP